MSDRRSPRFRLPGRNRVSLTLIVVGVVAFVVGAVGGAVNRFVANSYAAWALHPLPFSGTTSHAAEIAADTRTMWISFGVAALGAAVAFAGTRVRTPASNPILIGG